ncbi:MAG: type III pantothenate kinase [Sulfurimonas sp.]
MLLCDIGNTSYHFFDGKRDYKELVAGFDPSRIKEKIYYISVNSQTKNQLKNLTNWIDLEAFVDRIDYYETMGIDRIAALQSLQDAVVIDAGSAVTVDLLKNGEFEGGFIIPGVKSMQECYKNISDRLDYSFNFELDLGKMAKNSQDAISYGYLKPFYDEIRGKELPIILTGGDASEFKKLFPDATIDQELIFKGMKQIIKKAHLC